MSENLRILIVDDNEMMVKTLRDILKIKGYFADMAYSGPEALTKIEQAIFDCVLSDIKMPDINGVDLFRAIKQRQPNLPVVLMTAYATDKLVQEGLAEGVIAVLNKPLNISLLLNFLNFLSKEHSVVVVDDDLDFCQTLGSILQAKGYAVTPMTDPTGIMEKLADQGQTVLLDMKLKNSTGLDVLRQIRQKYPTLDVVLITGYPEEYEPAVKTALEINAYTCFYKPLQIEPLLQTLNQLHRRELSRALGQPHAKKT